jgi:hypothetical protein
MSRPTDSPIQHKLARVHRRLFVQALLNGLVWCWSGAILLAILWFLVHPLVMERPPVWVSWAVVGGLLAAATAVAALGSLLRAPSALRAALALDSKFALKERVTTSVTLTPSQARSPAGQALLADLENRIRDVDVGAGFPLHISWSAALLPVLGGLLALVAVFYPPFKNSSASAGTPEEPTKSAPNAQEIDQKMAELRKKSSPKTPVDKEKSEELKQLEAELEKIANKPRDSKEQLRERIKEMTALEEIMKNREREMADRSQSLKHQLERLDQMSKNDSGEGPAKDLHKALAEGKFDKAREEIERLAKRIQKNELTARGKDQLKRQLEDMQKKLERLAKQKDKEERLKQANLDAETLKRELDQLKKDGQKLNELQELANQMGKCQQCLKEGDMDGASQSLSSARDRLKNMDLDEENLSDLRDQLQRLEEAKGCCCKGECQGENPVGRDMVEDSEKSGVGAGKRPFGNKGGSFNSFGAKVKTEFDPKGKKIFDGYAPGQSFKKRNGVELTGEIKQASQEAPEAIEQQRIPKAAREMARGYFQKMREQAEQQRP